VLPLFARLVMRKYCAGSLLLAAACLGLLLAMPGSPIVAEDPVKSSSDLKLPEGYRIVPPEEWQRIQDKLAQLDALLKSDKPIEPTSCKLSGKIEGEVAHLQARFGFGTVRPKTTVLLGCTQGKPAAVSLDGQPSAGFGWNDSGWSVQV